jgi:hypothetical protein
MVFILFGLPLSGYATLSVDGGEHVGMGDQLDFTDKAGFATYANMMGSSDRAIAQQTRHKSLASLNSYVRVQDLWVQNAAVEMHF